MSPLGASFHVFNPALSLFQQASPFSFRKRSQYLANYGRRQTFVWWKMQKCHKQGLRFRYSEKGSMYRRGVYCLAGLHITVIWSMKLIKHSVGIERSGIHFKKDLWTYNWNVVKILLDVILYLMIESDDNLAHVMTAPLS